MELIFGKIVQIMELLHLVFYFSFLTFITIALAKGIRIAKSPVHLRWELYPIPNKKIDSKNVGSNPDELDFRAELIKNGKIHKLWSMLQEIFLLKGVWKHNRSLWFGSAPFHYAMYLYIVFTLLILVYLLVGLYPSAGKTQSHKYILFLNYLLWLITFLGILGSIVLLFKRIFDENLRLFSSFSHYFNIILIGSLYATTLIWLLSSKNAVVEIIGFYQGFLNLSLIKNTPLIGNVHFYLLSFFMFYLPFTHMTHFYMKYFTYHKVRWDDEPNISNKHIRKRLNEQLNLPVQWSAPHIGSDGRKTWLIITTTQIQNKG